MIPLLHDFTGETVLVFGGGDVGARKARRFAREARVVVVAPSFSGDAFGDAERVRAAPTADAATVAGWLDRTRPALVVAATDDTAMNAAIETAAAEQDVIVNRTDTAGSRPPGSVIVPATIREGDVVVAIATSGTSPALAAELRRRIEPALEGADELAAITADVREDLKTRGVAPADRRRALRAVAQSSAVWKDLGTGRTNVRRTVDAVVEAALGDKE